MKRCIPILLLTVKASAQFIVHDPANTAVNAAVQAGQAANHLEVLRQWAEQAEQLNRQLHQMEEQLAVQQRIRGVIGDPTAAGAGLALKNLGASELARSYGETLAATRRLANAIDSLRRTSEGIYRALDDRTALGRSFARKEFHYLRYAAVEREADNLGAAVQQADQRSAALQSDIAATLEQLRSASTQAEVDKLGIKLAALTGQLAEIGARRQEAAARIGMQHVLNLNQSEKERLDHWEKQLAEERHSLEVARDWQEAIKLTPGTYTRP